MSPKSARKSQRGFVAVAYAAMITTIVGFTGLAVDVGYMQYEKRRVQAAADAAAMGALRELELGNTDLAAAGQNDAALNGFTNGQSNTTVTINNPPQSGSYAGNNAAIEAVVQRNLPTFFMRIFGQNSSIITARAVARTSATEGSVGACIFAMDPSVSGAFTITGNVSISTACGAVVDSTSSSAFTMVGNSTINLANAQIGVVGTGSGGWSLSGGAQIINSTTGKAESPVNIQPFADPLANIPAPTPTGLAVQSVNRYKVNPSSAVTLNPGIYCDGMDLQGTVSLNPGVYVLAGGGLVIGAQATVTNTSAASPGGVVFYNTTSTSAAWGCNGNLSGGSFTFDGGASINLNAPTSGSQTGVLFFEDHWNVSGLSHKILGNSMSTFDGALYFLKSSLQFAGTNRTPGFLYIVADTITLNGNASLGNDHSNLTNVYTLAPHSTGGGLVE